MATTQAQLRNPTQASSLDLSKQANRFREDSNSISTSISNMNGITMSEKTESMVAAPQPTWTTPVAHGLRPRPATIHEGFSFCVAQGFDGLPAWDSSYQLQRPPSSVPQDFYPTTTLDSNSWVQKPCDGNLDIPGLDNNDMPIGQAYTTDEAVQMPADMRCSSSHMDNEQMSFDGVNPRRMSGSSFTVSTSGGMSEMASYDDYSTGFSDAQSLSSDYFPPSNRTSMISSTQLSPVASPRMTPQSRSELVRTQSRGRASPSPRSGVRAVPYSLENGRNKRWSTGSYGTVANRRPSPFVYHPPYDMQARFSSHQPSSAIGNGQLPLTYGNLQATQQHPYWLNSDPYQRNNMLLPSQLPSQAYHPEMQQFSAPPLMSHGIFRMLSSNADPSSLHNHYADSEPPDLYASLHEEQVPPPPEDMNPSDPDLVPHEQELRFEGDLYTPKWVRGHGNKREGWCGICKPGRWLVLKNSAFWYDKSFTHGISAATGAPFAEPVETRRMDGNPDVWEGLCGSCNEWIALVSSKKKGTTWFRHAYKCHSHPKIKDAPKRRRENSNSRALAASNVASNKPKQECITPQMTPATTMTGETPTPAKTATAPAPPPPETQQPLSSSQPQQQQTPQQEPLQPQLHTPSTPLQRPHFQPQPPPRPARSLAPPPLPPRSSSIMTPLPTVTTVNGMPMI